MTLAEIASGKVVGLVMSWFMNLLVLPHLLQTQISMADATVVSMVYLGVATLRSAIIRRVFETLRVKGIN